MPALDPAPTYEGLLSRWLPFQFWLGEEVIAAFKTVIAADDYARSQGGIDVTIRYAPGLDPKDVLIRYVRGERHKRDGTAMDRQAFADLCDLTNMAENT